jgi:hypothetical protein
MKNVAELSTFVGVVETYEDVCSLSQKGYFNKIEQEKAYQKWQKK